jgi:hypothetical protein
VYARCWERNVASSGMHCPTYLDILAMLIKWEIALPWSYRLFELFRVCLYWPISSWVMSALVNKERHCHVSIQDIVGALLKRNGRWTGSTTPFTFLEHCPTQLELLTPFLSALSIPKFLLVNFHVWRYVSSLPYKKATAILCFSSSRRSRWRQ